MTEVEFDGYNNQYLCCPKCNESYGLHQGSVEIYMPKNEVGRDFADGLYLRIAENRNVESCSPKNNPSLYRAGLRISFWCEHHYSDPEMHLVIFQHKGITTMQWEGFDDVK